MKSIFKRLLSHISLVILLLLLQIALFFWMVNYAASFWQWNIVFIFLSGITVFVLITKEDNPAYKLLWIIPILLFPVFGGAFYLFYKQRNFSKKEIKKHLKIEASRSQYIQGMTPALTDKRAYYLQSQNWMSYQKTASQFLPSGEAMLAQLLQDIEQAKSFIFLDFFIIKKGNMWTSILNKLKEKAQAGVEILIIYDDAGSAALPRNYPKTLAVDGIKAYKFNPIRLRLSFSNNYRSHRKIVVIDNKIGYSTGNNIGDEYININSKVGHWHDAGMRLEGEAVWSLTLTFLASLQLITGKSIDYQRYKLKHQQSDDGYIIPFADTPLDKEETTKNLYLSLIASAKKSIQVTTPYLIIDHELKTALSFAAKSGIDVRIIIPMIPDKKFVYMVTESHLPSLIQSGVKVYRYSPGFIHAKMMIIDQEEAMIGTANLDYRSLYLHFENTVYLKQASSILEMVTYFKDTLVKSKIVEVNEKHSLPYRFFRSIFKMFSGLL